MPVRELRRCNSRFICGLDTLGHNMKKLLLLFGLLFCVGTLHAQNITTQNLNGSGAVCAVGNPANNPWCLVVQLPAGTASVGITLSGTWSGTVQFVFTADGVNWTSLGTASSTTNIIYTFVPIGTIAVQAY